MMADRNQPISEQPPGAISVVVPVKDRPDDLARVVEAVLEQSLLPDELIIVDQSTSTAGADRVRALFDRRGSDGPPSLTYIHDPAINGLTAARNEGLRRSRSPIVVYLDDDAIPDRDGLLLLSQALKERPDLVAAGGIITNYRRPPRWSLALRRIFYRGSFWDDRQPIYWNWRRYARGQIVPTGKITGSCMALRRSALVAVGGFDERYRGSSVGEDVEVSQRLLRYAGRKDALGLVAGAWLVHESRGQWKRGDRSAEFEIVAAHYLFRKNLPATLPNITRFLWMSLGMLLIGGLAAVRRRSPRPLMSVFAGIRCVCAGYAGCPFLKPEIQTKDGQESP